MISFAHNLRGQAAFLKHLATGRKFFLSYPKSGRTWVSNIVLNYWYRREKSITEPLPFTPSTQAEPFLVVESKPGLTFTHGGMIKDLLDQKFETMNPLCLGSLNYTVLIRNPIDTLVSFFHHIAHSRPDVAKAGLETFVYSERGYRPMAGYYNHVLPLVLKNERALVVTYESLHPSSQNRLFHLLQLISHLFGTVDRDSLLWADEVCSIDLLRARSEGQTKRIRKGQVGAEELSQDVAADIMEKFMAMLNEPAKSAFLLVYPSSDNG